MERVSGSVAANLLVRSVAFGWSLLRRLLSRAFGEPPSDAQMAFAVAQDLRRVCARGCTWAFDRQARMFFGGVLLGKADYFVDRRSLHRESERVDRRPN